MAKYQKGNKYTFTVNYDSEADDHVASLLVNGAELDPSQRIYLDPDEPRLLNAVSLVVESLSKLAQNIEESS